MSSDRMIACAALMLAAMPALAAGPVIVAPPEGAVLTAEEHAGLDSFALAVRRFGAREAVLFLEGAISTRAWRLDGDGPTLEVLRSLRAQLGAAGFTTRLDCDQDACGGYDFRFAIPVLPPPGMEVDLTDYRYYSATRTAGGKEEGAALLVSRTAEAAWVQLTLIGPEEAQAPVAENAEASALPSVPEIQVAPGLEALTRDGKMALDGLEFASGEAGLAADPGMVLQALAAYLAANPDTRLILVGHTDNQGSLASNMQVSRRRAETVRDALVRDHGVAPERLTVEGIGFLAPRASNDTEEGRARNRRVEAVIE